ncbi:MAG: hypothetical protein WDZ93_02045 [Candidatus Paceibacterota bacterium]
MDILDAIREPELEPASFRRIAEMLFDELTVDIFQNKEEARAYVESVDGIIDAAQSDGNTLHTERIIQLAAALGEAFIILFEGEWKYDEEWERWVVACATNAGDPVHLNVFNKLEKRVANGDEDSISYYFEGTQSLIDGSLKI